MLLMKNSYDAPPAPEKVAVSPSQSVIVAGAVKEPGNAVIEGTGKGVTATWKGSENSEQTTLLRLLINVLLKKVVLDNAVVGV